MEPPDQKGEACTYKGGWLAKKDDQVQLMVANPLSGKHKSHVQCAGTVTEVLGELGMLKIVISAGYGAKELTRSISQVTFVARSERPTPPLGQSCYPSTSAISPYMH